MPDEAFSTDAEDEAAIALERLDELEESIAAIDARARVLELQANNPDHPNHRNAQLAAAADARLRAQWVAEFEALVRYLASPEPAPEAVAEPAEAAPTAEPEPLAAPGHGLRLDLHA